MIRKAPNKLNADNILPIALLGSLFLHLFIAIFIQFIKIPDAPSSEQYERWVQKISFEERTIVIPKEVVHEPQALEEEKPQEKTGNEAKAKPKKIKKQKVAAKPKPVSVRKAVQSAGLLQAIGVAGDSGALGDIFSEGGGLSDDIAGALKEGAKTGGFGVANAKDALERSKLLKKGAKDIGGVRLGGTGSVEGGKLRAGKLPTGSVEGGGIESVAGVGNQDAIAKVLRRRRPGFQRCYERELKKLGTLSGLIAFAISIDGRGRVARVKLLEDTLKAPPVWQCVESILKRTRFPKSTSGIITVKSKLVFSRS